VEQDVKCIDENSVTLEENKNISLPSADVQNVPELELNTTKIENVKQSIELLVLDLNTNNLEKVIDEKKLDDTVLEIAQIYTNTK
jgi:hypothetical protein